MTVSTPEPATLVRPEGAPLPNVVFILVDTLRADRLGCYGHAGELSPTMDRIAGEGVLFERCIAPAPWTLPSVASLITCYQPPVHRCTDFRQIDAMDRGRTPVLPVLNDGFTTLAEVMLDVGYDTGGFVANKFIKKKYGFGQGYNRYETEAAANTVRGERINEAALRWLDARAAKDRPFFLYLHYMDVHGPYNAAPKFMDPLMAKVEANADKRRMGPDLFKRINSYLRRPAKNASDPTRFERLKYFREYWVARYEAGVREMDDYLAQLIAALEQRGLWDDTLVVLTADHGEALGEHGLWDHGYSVYQTDLHVPLILRWPGTLPAGLRVKKTASLLGVMPTLFDVLDLDFAQNVQGSALTPHIADLPTADTIAIGSSVKYPPQQWAIVRDNWKMIAMQQNPKKRQGGIALLYDLDVDPGEMSPVSSQNPEIVRALSTILQERMNASATLKPGLRPGAAVVPPDELEQLKAVGYVAGGSDEAEDDDEDEADEPGNDTRP